MNYKKLITPFLIVLACYADAQQPTVELKGRIILSEGQGIPYGLRDDIRHSISVNDLIYDQSLSFIGRQISDSSFLNIDIRNLSVRHEFLPGSFFIFRLGNSPVQQVMKKSLSKRRIGSTMYDSILYYNFKEKKIVGAVALKREETKDGYKHRAESGGIVHQYGDNGLYTAEFLKEKKASFFHSYPLLKTRNANGSETILNLEDYVPATWQTIDMNTPDPVFNLEIPSTQMFSTGFRLSTDIRNDFVFLAGQYWNKATNKWFTVTEKESRANTQLIPGGKIFYTKRGEEVTKKGTNRFTRIIKYDLVSGTIEKEIVVPDKKEYEAFFSPGGRYAILYDKSPDVPRFSPKLFDLETGLFVADIPLPSLLETGIGGKKIKLKGSMAEIRLAANFRYDIKDIIFSNDMKHFVITCYLDLLQADPAIVYMVGDKPYRYNEIIYVFEIK